MGYFIAKNNEILQQETSSAGMDWNGRPSEHVPLLTWNKRAGSSRMSHEMLQPHINLEAKNIHNTKTNK